MVLIVTVNPLLEQRLQFDKIESGKVNRSNHLTYKAGGKGINVGRQLNLLGISNTSLAFNGGHNGKIFRKAVSEEKINCVFITTKEDVRSASLIIEKDKNRITSYFGPDTFLSVAEISEFKNKLDKMIQNSSLVVFSGSSPSEEAGSIFTHGIELAGKYDKFVLLDTYGSHLQECLNLHPTCIHNNISEIENSLKINLENENDKIDFLNYLYGKGIKLSFLTDGDNPSFAANFDFHYKITNPVITEIDATGSGDAFVAGLIYGFDKNLIFEETCRIASALGIANAAGWDVCNVSKNEMNFYLQDVKINSLGKKIKIIDDSPTNIS